MRVCHISPTYFGLESVIGGGERFAEELARAMATHCDVKFISFGPKAMRHRIGPRYERVILRNWTSSQFTPFSLRLFWELRKADVIHCHQYHALPTFMAAVWGRLRDIPVFVTALGGGGWTPAYHIDQSRWIAAHLPLSRYAARQLPGRNQRYHIIYAGVDLQQWRMRQALQHDGSVVFLGRILPHKGVHFLIQGLPKDMTLKIIGPILDVHYYNELQGIAREKRVQFLHGLTDDEVRSHLQCAMAIVHPTPVDATGSPGVNELFGLAVVEAMACGCVPVVPKVGPWPEIVEDGISGLLIPPNCPQGVQEALERLRQDNAWWVQLSQGARTRVEQNFTWDRVVERCLEAYQMYGDK